MAQEPKGGINQINRKAIVKSFNELETHLNIAADLIFPPAAPPAAAVKASDLWMINSKHWKAWDEI